MPQDLASLNALTKQCAMSFNATEYIVSTDNKGAPYFYQWNGHVLEYKKDNLSLGVLISDSVTFDTHIANTSKASRQLGILRQWHTSPW